mmetsp:Transcript_39160/g.47095  ORF Transcript_39160/g.47095 Transcript_39160/m.47095 type:complete len:109 (+) Transcript_39160:748-1074(+)
METMESKDRRVKKKMERMPIPLISMVPPPPLPPVLWWGSNYTGRKRVRSNELLLLPVRPTMARVVLVDILILMFHNTSSECNVAEIDASLAQPTRDYQPCISGRGCGE